MHRVIAKRMGLDFTYSTQIDHINQDKLDNRRENLRLATPTQNNCNRGLRRNNTTGVKGVSIHSNGRYYAYVAIGGKRVYNAYFGTLEEAAAGVKEARKRIQGEFNCDV